MSILFFNVLIKKKSKKNNGNGTFPSNCSSILDYHVMNVEKVEFEFLNLSFSVHSDHSKWAVTQLPNHFIDDSTDGINQGAQVACIGDINRQEDQLTRAGGTVCFLNNTNVWHGYFKLVRDYEKCSLF